MIEYILERKNVKNINIRIRDKKVYVSANRNVTEKYIDTLILEKMDWINKTLEYSEQKKEKSYGEGDYLLFLGEEKEIVHSKENKTINYFMEKDKFFVYNIEKMPINIREAYTKKFFLDYCIENAIKIFEPRVKIHSKKMEVYPAKVTIRKQKTRWGSFSSKGSLNLNIKLIMAPMDIIDHVIIHELSHSFEMNHSKNFWNIVKKYDKDYKKHNSWLKNNGHLIEF